VVLLARHEEQLLLTQFFRRESSLAVTILLVNQLCGLPKSSISVGRYPRHAFPVLPRDHFELELAASSIT